MNCEQYTIKVVEGNEFSLLFPLKYRTYVDDVATDTDIDCTLLEDCVVTIGDTEYDVSLGTDGVLVVVPATLARGAYDIELTATYESSAIRVAIHNGLKIVQYSGQSDTEQYIAGSPIVADAAFVIGGPLTDDEVETLKEELQEKIDEYETATEEAETAKEEWEEKAAALDDLATETNATANKAEILEALSGITIDTSDLAKQGDNEDATNTAILEAVETLQTIAGAAEAYSEGKAALAEAITDKGVETAETDSLATMAENVAAIQNVDITLADTDIIDYWTGYTSPLNLIHTYYSATYPTAQCAILRAGSVVTVASGAARLIYTDSDGNITTIDSPSGDYTIGEYEAYAGVGFALVQYSDTAINILPYSSKNIISYAAYNAEVYVSGYAGSILGIAQFESCIIELSASAFSSSKLSAFILIDSTIKDNKISGISTFYNCTALVSVSLPTLTTISGGGTFGSCSALVSVSLPTLTTISGNVTFQYCSALVSVSLPTLTTISGSNTFYSCSALVSVSIPQCSSISRSSTFSNDVNLIDIEIGAAMTASFSLASWSPTNALSSSSTSLVEDGETFSSNLEKLLYNIREHIAANLSEDVGSETITFSSAVKAAINADEDTLAAFPSNWTIA